MHEVSDLVPHSMLLFANRRNFYFDVVYRTLQAVHLGLDFDQTQVMAMQRVENLVWHNWLRGGFCERKKARSCRANRGDTAPPRIMMGFAALVNRP